MMRIAWAVAMHDLRLWLKSPAIVATALLPALGLGALVGVMSATLGVQPVALVQEGEGPWADWMAHLLAADGEAYALTRSSRAEAADALWDQRAAAVLVIPKDFDQRLATADAHVELVLNNVVDVDLADDIRRTVTRSLAELDAPQLGVLGERHTASEVVLPNPFRVAIAETDLRKTDVGFLAYQMVPILVLIVLSLGVLATSMLLARDMERGSARWLAMSPAPRASLVAGKLLGGASMVLSALGPGVAAGAALGLLSPPPGHWPALLLLLALLVLLGVGLGLLLGLAVRRTELTALAGLNVVAYLFFLGGGFTTVPFLPTWIQRASLAMPTRYAIDGLRQVLFYPDLTGVRSDVIALSASTAGVILLATFALGRTWRTS
jgi:ABC-2 type transport system permease protein